MRFAKIYRAIAWERKISTAAKAVYIALAQYADKTRRCWPSRPTLEKDTGLSNKTLSKALKELRSWGIIQWDEGNTGKANLYTLHDEKVAAMIERQELDDPVEKVSGRPVEKVSTNENHSSSDDSPRVRETA